MRLTFVGSWYETSFKINIIYIHQSVKLIFLKTNPLFLDASAVEIPLWKKYHIKRKRNSFTTIGVLLNQPYIIKTNRSYIYEPPFERNIIGKHLPSKAEMQNVCHGHKHWTKPADAFVLWGKFRNRLLIMLSSFEQRIGRLSNTYRMIWGNTCLPQGI